MIDPLDEETEAPQLDASPQPRVVPENDPTHRRLAAIAGAGNVYVFLVVTPDDQVSLEFRGVTVENLPELLRQVAAATS